MLSVQKKIRVSRLDFPSVSELRSYLMDIVKGNYTEYNVSRQIIKFYPSWGFRFNRGIEGNITITDHDGHYMVVVRLKSGVLPFLIALFIVILGCNILTDFDIKRLFFTSLLFLPFLLLHLVIFYSIAKTRLKIFDANIGTVL